MVNWASPCQEHPPEKSREREKPGDENFDSFSSLIASICGIIVMDLKRIIPATGSYMAFLSSKVPKSRETDAQWIISERPSHQELCTLAC